MKKEFQIIREDLICRKYHSELQDNSDYMYTCSSLLEDDFSLKVLVTRREKQCQVSVGTIFSGPFKIPAGATLVSAIYDVTIAHDQKTKLQNPLEITVQHCVDVTDSKISSNMCFAFAECDLRNEIFEFKEVEHGTIGKDRGTIEVKESCCLCILYFER